MIHSPSPRAQGVTYRSAVEKRGTDAEGAEHRGGGPVDPALYAVAAQPDLPPSHQRGQRDVPGDDASGMKREERHRVRHDGCVRGAPARPAEPATAHTISPVPIPNAARRATAVPCRVATPRTRAVSGPGRSVTMTAAGR